MVDKIPDKKGEIAMKKSMVLLAGFFLLLAGESGAFDLTNNPNRVGNIPGATPSQSIGATMPTNQMATVNLSFSGVGSDASRSAAQDLMNRAGMLTNQGPMIDRLRSGGSVSSPLQALVNKCGSMGLNIPEPTTTEEEPDDSSPFQSMEDMPWFPQDDTTQPDSQEDDSLLAPLEDDGRIWYPQDDTTPLLWDPDSFFGPSDGEWSSDFWENGGMAWFNPENWAN